MGVYHLWRMMQVETSARVSYMTQDEVEVNVLKNYLFTLWVQISHNQALKVVVLYLIGPTVNRARLEQLIQQSIVYY